MQLFKTVDYPIPEYKEGYMFSSLYCAMKGWSLFLILGVIWKTSRNWSIGKGSLIGFSDKVQ